MKNLILILTVLFNLNLYSQITVEETAKVEDVYRHTMGFHAIYKAVNPDSTESYSLTFKDCQYQQISVYESIMFSSKQDMIDFFNIINQVIETKESKTLSILNQTVVVSYFNRNAKVYLNNAFCWFSTKWVQKCLDSL
jgi:hypothetical protein